MKRNHKGWILLCAALIFMTSCSTPITDGKEIAPATEENASIALSTPAFEIAHNPSLTHIDMLDAQNGWAQAEGMILRTENGGETWLNVTPPDILSNPSNAKTFFLDETTGWVLLEDIDKPHAGEIYRTTDGGGLWQWRNAPFGRANFGFIDNDHGYALFSMGAAAGSMGVSIWTSNNGGGDFGRVFYHEPGFEYSMPFSGIKNGISFRDPLNGWVGGSVPMDGVIWLYRSVDGGISWFEQEVSLPTGYENYQTSTYPPLFFDNGLATLPVQLSGEQSGYVFFQSQDGGETWKSTQPIGVHGYYSIVSPNEIVVWDGTWGIHFTSDGGNTWILQAPSSWQPGEALRELDFVNINEGWALTDDGLHRTQDGGKTWEKLE